MSTDALGVLVTLDPTYRDYAEAEGKRLHAKYAGVQKFGARTERDRIESSAARRAVEQLLELPPGSLRHRGLDCVSTRNPNTDYVHIRPEHRGRVYAAAGPLDSDGTYVIYGSILVERAKARPKDEARKPPAHVWRVDELDPPPGAGRGVRPHRTEPKPDTQLQLLDQRAGRAHDRQGVR